MFFQFSKRLIAKNLSKFNIYFNYHGLRFETINIKKRYIYKKEDSLIVCTGDSNTFGWNYKYQMSYPQILERNLNSYISNIKVINCGIGGATIIDSFNRYENDILFFDPETVIINFGFNDGMLTKLQRNNNNEKKSNLIYEVNNNYYSLKIKDEIFIFYLEKLIKNLKNNFVNIILTGLYKVNKIKIDKVYSDDKKLVDLQNLIYKEYDNLIKKLAIKNDIVFFDLWNKLNNYEKIKNYFQDDGFHLNITGYKLLADSLCEIILEKHLF
ncbi:MAG: SGNH/GDSL hydrolase family protein [Actinobacteria bacterium]|nr:SGNH/GDSL hydrolase family protein [Actinomycetota bacterium]